MADEERSETLARIRRELGLADKGGVLSDDEKRDQELAKIKLDLYKQGKLKPSKLEAFEFGRSPPDFSIPARSKIDPHDPEDRRRSFEDWNRKKIQEREQKQQRVEALRSLGPYAGMSAPERYFSMFKRAWKDTSLVSEVPGLGDNPTDVDMNKDRVNDLFTQIMSEEHGLKAKPIDFEDPAWIQTTPGQFHRDPKEAGSTREAGIANLYNTQMDAKVRGAIGKAIRMEREERSRPLRDAAEQERQFSALEAEDDFGALATQASGSLAGLLTDIAAVPGGGLLNVPKVAAQAAFVPELKHEIGSAPEPHGTMIGRGLHAGAAMTLGGIGGKVMEKSLQAMWKNPALWARLTKGVAAQGAVGMGFGTSAAIETGDIRHIYAEGLAFAPLGLRHPPKAEAPRAKVDPLFKDMAKGNRPAYLMPGLGNQALKTPSERSFRPPPDAMLMDMGIIRVSVPGEGILFVNTNHPMFAGKDVREVINKHVAEERFHEVLGYSEAAQRSEATHTVTGRDADGREVVSVDTKDPNKEARELLKVEGIERVDPERPYGPETNLRINTERAIEEASEPPAREPGTPAPPEVQRQVQERLTGETRPAEGPQKGGMAEDRIDTLKRRDVEGEWEASAELAYIYERSGNEKEAKHYKEREEALRHAEAEDSIEKPLRENLKEEGGLDLQEVVEVRSHENELTVAVTKGSEAGETVYTVNLISGGKSGEAEVFGIHAHFDSLAKAKKEAREVHRDRVEELKEEWEESAGEPFDPRLSTWIKKRAERNDPEALEMLADAYEADEVSGVARDYRRRARAARNREQREDSIRQASRPAEGPQKGGMAAEGPAAAGVQPPKDPRPAYMRNPTLYAAEKYPSQPGKPLAQKKKSIGQIVRDVLAGREGPKTTEQAGTKFGLLQRLSRLRERLSRYDYGGGTLAHGRGKKPPGRAPGAFYGTSETTRVRGRGDAETQAHEAAHFLQIRLFGGKREERLPESDPRIPGERTFRSDHPFFKKHEEALKELDYQRDPETGKPLDGGRAWEGFAEFIKSYLLFPEETARDFAEMVKDFDAEVLKHDAKVPYRQRIAAELEGFQRDHQIWLRSDRSAAQVFRPGQRHPFDGLGKNLALKVDRWYSDMVNEQHIFEVMEDLVNQQRLAYRVEMAEKGKKVKPGETDLTPSESPSVLAQAVRGGPETVGRRFLMRKPVDGSTMKNIEDAKSFSEIIKPITEETNPEFSAYMNDRVAMWRLKYKELVEKDLEQANLDLERARESAREASKPGANVERLPEVRDARERVESLQAERKEAIRLRQAALKYLESISTKESDLEGIIKNRESRHPEFAEVAEGFRTYRDHLGRFAVELGLTSESHHETMMRRHHEWAPWNRENVDRVFGPGGVGGRIMDIQKAPSMRRLEGSELPIKEAIPGMILNTHLTTRLAQAAEIAQRLGRVLDELEGSDAFARDVEKPTVAIKGKVGEIIKQLEQAGVEVEGVDKDIAITLFRPDQMFGLMDNNILKYRDVDGKTRYKEITNPLLLRALVGLQQDKVSPWLKIGVMAKDLLRSSVVASVGFPEANIFRDFPGGKYNTGKWNFIEFVQAIGDIFVGNYSERYRRFEDTGAVQSSLIRMAFGKEYETATEMLANRAGHRFRTYRDVKDFYKNWKLFVDLIRFRGELSEFPVRMAAADVVFKNPKMKEVTLPDGTKAKVMAESEKDLFLRATVAAKEASIDFSRHGGAEWMKGWAAITAFLNPHIQGLDKTYRVAKTRPADAAMYFGGITAFSMGLYVLNNQGEHKRRLYSMLTKHDKNAYWPVFVFTESQYKEKYDPIYKAAYEKYKHLPDDERDVKAQVEADVKLKDWVNTRTKKIPVPHELALPGKAAERIVLDPIFQDKKVAQGAADFAMEAVTSLTPPMVPNAVDMGLKTAGIYLPTPGRFRGKKISQIKRESTKNVAQYTDTTPIIFREIAEWTRDGLSMFGYNDSFVAPVDLEAAFNIGIIRDANELLDASIRWDEDAREEYGIKIGQGGTRDIPLLSGVARRFTVRVGTRGAEALDEIYEKIKASDSAYNTVQDALKKRDIEKVIKYRTQFKTEYENHFLLKGIKKVLNDDAGKIKIYRNKQGKLEDENGDLVEMDNAKRREMIDRIVFKDIILAERALKLLDVYPLRPTDWDHHQKMGDLRSSAEKEWK